MPKMALMVLCVFKNTDAMLNNLKRVYDAKSCYRPSPPKGSLDLDYVEDAAATLEI